MKIREKKTRINQDNNRTSLCPPYDVNQNVTRPIGSISIKSKALVLKVIYIYMRINSYVLK